MPEFKNRDEYEKWKAKRLENIRRLEREEGQNSKSFQTLDVQSPNQTLSYSPKQKFKSIITIIGLLIVVGSIFLYANLQKNKKTWPDIIQETKKAVVIIKTPNSIGSGFLVSPDGLIITNSHVIQNNSDVEVIFNSKESKKASIIKNGIVPLDIAILKVAGENYDFLTLADSNNCKEGEEVVAIGAPLALSETVTKGIISNCNRQLKAELSDIKYIQTDVPVNPGNSGGPLINSKGEVLGILTWKIAEKNSEGLNFAIAINVAKDFMNGKLVKLEETVRQMEEERLQREQQEKQIISYLFFYTYNVLSSTWMNEYTSYYNRVVWMVERRVLSVEQGKQLLQRVIIPPQGFSSISDWLSSLTVRILKGEITVDEATNLIRSSFV